MASENHSFYFKQFVVRHDECSMKVGTDGVLLGAWVSVANSKSVLDIGTGSGVIALMIAQRTTEDVMIDGVEAGEPDFRQAKSNAENSPWSARIKMWHAPIQEFAKEKLYDLIVSNPPFFVNSSPPPDAGRHAARHAHTLSYEDLLLSVDKHLNAHGRFAVILPTDEATLFIKLAAKHSLFCVRQLAFYARAHKRQERWLLEFGRTSEPSVAESLVLHGQGNAWSSDYQTLMQDFYLAL